MARATLLERVAAGLCLASLAVQPALAGPKLEAPIPLKETTALGRVTLAWTNIGGETGFLIERRAYGAGGFSEVAKTTADVTTYSDILATEVSYEYRVRAYRAQGTVTFSDYTNTVVSTVECE